KNYRSDFDFVLHNIDSIGASTAACGMSGIGDWFDEVKTNLFASTSDLTKTEFSNLTYSESSYYGTGNNWKIGITFREMSPSQRTRFYDTLTNLLEACYNFEVEHLFYIPRLSDIDLETTLCVESVSDTICYACDTLKHYIKDYQLSLSNDTFSYAYSMSPQLVESYLESNTGSEFNVYEGT